MELDTNFFSRCESALKQAAKDKMLSLAAGGFESFSEAKYECGVIRGLNDALFIIEEVLTTMSKEQR